MASLQHVTSLNNASTRDLNRRAGAVKTSNYVRCGTCTASFAHASPCQGCGWQYAGCRKVWCAHTADVLSGVHKSTQAVARVLRVKDCRRPFLDCSWHHFFISCGGCFDQTKNGSSQRPPPEGLLTPSFGPPGPPASTCQEAPSRGPHAALFRPSQGPSSAPPAALPGGPLGGLFTPPICPPRGASETAVGN